jgi:hypothetical protein
VTKLREVQGKFFHVCGCGCGRQVDGYGVRTAGGEILCDNPGKVVYNTLNSCNCATLAFQHPLSFLLLRHFLRWSDNLGNGEHWSAGGARIIDRCFPQLPLGFLLQTLKHVLLRQSVDLRSWVLWHLQIFICEGGI